MGQKNTISQFCEVTFAIMQWPLQSPQSDSVLFAAYPWGITVLGLVNVTHVTCLPNNLFAACSLG